MKEYFSNWTILFSHYIKRDKVKIVCWILGVSLFAAGFLPAFKEIAKGQGLAAMYETLKNPAMVSMVGPTPVSSHAYTIGALFSQTMLLFTGMFAAIISALHVISHTRKEEDLGLSELIRSFQVGRQSSSLAVILETVVINVALSVVTFILLIVLRVDSITITGSILYACSIGIAGLLGAAIALVFAQVMPSSSNANGVTLSIIGCLYLLRASSDISNVSLSMLNPIGWMYLTYPYTQNNGLPILYGLLFSVLCILLAFRLEGIRDMGAGFIKQREGREHAKHSLLSIHGLLLRINKGIIIAWLVCFAILGSAYGSIYGDIQSFLNANALMKSMFEQSGSSIEASFSATIMMVTISFIGILLIALINSLYKEESSQRLGVILSTKVSRTRLYFTTIIITTIISIIAIIISALSLGGTALMVMKEGSTLTLFDFITAGFNYLPVLLLMIGISSLLLGYLPKLGKLVYLYLGYTFVLNYFTGILNFPDWLLKTTPQAWLSKMPVESFNLVPFILITMISIVLIYIGYLGYKKRDFQEQG